METSRDCGQSGVDLGGDGITIVGKLGVDFGNAIVDYVEVGLHQCCTCWYLLWGRTTAIVSYNGGLLSNQGYLDFGKLGRKICGLIKGNLLGITGQGLYPFWAPVG